MQKQNGFTLVELVVVIIILGILAVTAAPKFIGIQSDARVASLKGLQASINGANTMVYGKSVLKGEQGDIGGANFGKPPVILAPNGTKIYTSYGYIMAETSSMENALNLNVTDSLGPNNPKADPDTLVENYDWTITSAIIPNSTAHVIRFWQKNAPATCYLEYSEPKFEGDIPVFSKLPSVSDC